jgi:ribonuclease E
MAKRMLIDAVHSEETRVVILDDNQIFDFDFVTSSKKQLKGNIYLAKITRVEPSLQAAFVEYGGGKQGFLPFSEIHTDYYQIPVSDRKRLMEEAEREAETEDRLKPANRHTHKTYHLQMNSPISALTSKTISPPNFPLLFPRGRMIYCLNKPQRLKMKAALLT